MYVCVGGCLYMLCVSDVVYGRRMAWRRPVLSLPREVGLVAREAALTIVASHLTNCLPRVHNLNLVSPQHSLHPILY